MMAAIVAPAGVRSIARMQACLVPGCVAGFADEGTDRVRDLGLLVFPVPDAFGGDLPFELGKGQEHIECQPAHGEVVVLNCWVTETNDTPWESNSSTSLAKSANDRVRRSTL